MKLGIVAIYFFLAVFVFTFQIQRQQIVHRSETSLPKKDGVVSWVADGDTIKLETGELVRLIGIDAPETGEGSTTKECYGKEAREFLAGLLTGKHIVLTKDISDTDHYGRLLRYVYEKDTLINEQIVRLGYAHARAYLPDIALQEVFKKAEYEAQKEQKGLWRLCQ